MKVLMINGSPRINGNTAFALNQMGEVFAQMGIETETIQVGNQPVTGCRACGACYKLGHCVIDDVVNETAEKLANADGIVVGSPVYFASPNGTLISFLDRLFYSSGRINKRMKVGASVVCARRGGTTASMDVLNKYFTICEMPVASTTYWNIIHGAEPGEAEQDAEGVRTVRNLAKNMGYMMQALAAAKDSIQLPEHEKRAYTNFIR